MEDAGGKCWGRRDDVMRIAYGGTFAQSVLARFNSYNVCLSLLYIVKEDLELLVLLLPTS